jgi:hypothetical protein
MSTKLGTTKPLIPELHSSKRPTGRDRVAEKRVAKGKQAIRLGQLLDDRNTGKLGEEVIKIAQAMLLCTLPYSATAESHITRTARLGDGSTLTVTFSTGIPDVPLPFGSDRKLLAWVFDRAINSESPLIAWDSAWEYQKEMGLKRSGKNNKDLRERFHRISGLNINIERKDTAGITGKNFSIIDTYNLPPSISGRKFNPDQRSLGYAAETLELPPAPFGISINQTLFHDIRKHHIAVPRSLWLQAKGNSQVHDMMLWLYYRCYAAKTESIIPWSALAEQFPQDKNPRRARQHAREAIVQLRLLWPGVRVESTATGIWVDKATQSLLLDDPTKGRMRRLN